MQVNYLLISWCLKHAPCIVHITEMFLHEDYLQKRLLLRGNMEKNEEFVAIGHCCIF